MSLTISHDYHTKIDPFECLCSACCCCIGSFALAALHDTVKGHVEERALERERQQKRLLLLRMKQRSRWNSFLMPSSRCRLIVILRAIEIAM